MTIIVSGVRDPVTDVFLGSYLIRGLDGVADVDLPFMTLMTFPSSAAHSGTVGNGWRSMSSESIPRIGASFHRCSFDYILVRWNILLFAVREQLHFCFRIPLSFRMTLKRRWASRSGWSWSGSWHLPCGWAENPQPQGATDQVCLAKHS